MYVRHLACCLGVWDVSKEKYDTDVFKTWNLTDKKIVAYLPRTTCVKNAQILYIAVDPAAQIPTA